MIVRGRGKSRIPGVLMGYYPEEAKDQLIEAIKDLDDWVYYTAGTIEEYSPKRIGCIVYSDKSREKIVFSASKELQEDWEVNDSMDR